MYRLCYAFATIVLIAALAGTAGATKALVFQFASLTDVHWQMSGEVVLMTLLGGMGTPIGPLLGTGIMHYLIDITSGFTSGYLFVVGGVLLLLVLWFPQGLMGAVRTKWLSWLP